MIEWIDKTNCSLECKPFLEKACTYFFKNLDISKNIVFVLVSKKEIRALNKTYRKKDRLTDVLSFESYEKGVLGELVFCPDVISKQALEHGFLFKEEFIYLMLHGVLHLLGYEHEGGRLETEKMFELQDKLFEEFLDQA